MSGPKDDRVTIERRRKEELERQRKIEQERRIRVLNMQNQYAESIAKARFKISYLEDKLKSFGKTLKEYEITPTPELTSFKDTVKALPGRLAEFPQKMTTENEEDLKNQQQKIDSFLATLNFSQELSKVEASLDARYTDSLMQAINQLCKKIKKKDDKSGKMKSDIKKAFTSALLPSQQEEETNSKAQVISKIEMELSEMDSYPILPSAIKNQLEDIKSSFEHLKQIGRNNNSIDIFNNFYALTVVPALKSFKPELEKYRKIYEEFKQKFVEYIVLCQKAGVKAKEYSLTSEDSVIFIQSEIDKLNKICKRRNFENYIQKSINEVMTEMGYNLIGDLKDKSKKVLESRLYQFDRHTAVCVTLNSSGDICMELGGMDDTDREPDMKEASALKSDMEIFCTRHKEIKERLAEKGVVLSANHELPPAVEYAQIFNLKDFDIGDEKINELLQDDNKQLETQATELKHLSL